ncbi:DUF3037 domain-containing protein [Rhodococcus erythropolis]|uniref:DUF3037 domain-containing protein n=1 Tax=Rhodococcus erythropolis TaxID=1833 RepID=UPI0012910E01|nr:DUF3037 domain-containing protein [Rhodococcus erythropolis]MQP33166.1 DUF3037 domain-containing protein [Rhodococcus erythropolis]
MRYLYWTLRYLPDAVRGEFVNIGVIVGRDGQDWAIRTIENFERASRIGGDLSVAKRWAHSLRQDIEANSHRAHLAYTGKDFAATEGWLDRMREFHNNSIQVSEAMPVVAQTANEGADLLYARLVVDPARAVRSTSHTRAVARLTEAYSDISDDYNVLKRVKVNSGRQSMDFDFALTNRRIEHLSRVWSFDVKDPSTQVEKVQAWGFRIEQLRESGGELTAANEKTIHVDQDVPVRILYVPPNNAAGLESLDIARDAWNRIEAKAFPIEHARQLVAA